jgi:hypothetical protein
MLSLQLVSRTLHHYMGNEDKRKKRKKKKGKKKRSQSCGPCGGRQEVLGKTKRIRDSE